jgi:hypothetical protein
MLWMDSDGFCTRKWNLDPVAMVIRNNVTILFDSFPKGKSYGEDFDLKYHQAFKKRLCKIRMVDGYLEPTWGSCRKPRIFHIHGFFHITDLDFYRSEPVQNWLTILIGDSKFSRRYDDQIAVTVPAAVLSPRRAWDMEYHGFRPEVFHNHFLDGKYKLPYGKGFSDKFWPINGTTNFPEASGKCRITAWS